MTQTRYRLLLIAVGLVALVGGWYSAGQFQSGGGDRGLQGFGGDFTLESAAGPVSLADYRGKAVALYFGYASCPDVCPVSLANMAAAFQALPADEQGRVQGIFISVDPERDPPAVAQEYAQAFDPRIVGVTGPLDALQRVARQFGALFARVEMEDSALGYAMDHSSVIYVIRPDGVVHSLVQHGTAPDEIAGELEEALRAG
jgi:protein SCO1/2